MSYSKLKSLFLLNFFLCCGLSSWAQTPGFHIEDTNSAGGENIQIDITVSDFYQIQSFDFTLEWDTLVILYDTVGNFNLEGFTVGNTFNPHNEPHKLIVQWNDSEFTTIESLDDDEVLFSLFFSADCDAVGSTVIGFDPGGAQEASNINNQLFTPPILTTGTLTFTEALNMSSSTTSAISCNGAADACVQANTSGGQAPYTFLWSNGGTTSEICNLAPGSYSCTVTDAGNCSIVSSPINITDPTILTICQNSTTDPTCLNGSDGCISVEACGGSASLYTYAWSNNSGTTAEICNLNAGNYTCTVTDINGCTASMMFTLNNPSNPLSLQNSTVEDATCAVGGMIDLSIVGGNNPIEYDWSNNETSQDVNDLPIGTYACTITDDEGCAIVTPTFSVALIGNDMTSSNIATDVDCFGGDNGTIDLTVNGNATPFSYDWSNNETSQDLDDLEAGSYSCTITDAGGCTIMVSNIIVAQPSSAVTVNSLNKVDILCTGEETGSISLDIGGGNSPYTYLWNTGATTSGISNLPAGSYDCVVTDNKGCTTTSGNITISQPSSAIAISNAIVTDVSCFDSSDGSISISPSGGTAPYEYLWSNNETTSNLSDLPIGEYQCTITDNNDCTFVTNMYNVLMPSAVTIDNNTTTNANCSGGGAIELTISGGSIPYSFLWNNGTSANPLSNVTAGNYACTITDNNGCSVVSPSYNVDLVDSDLTFTNSIINPVDCFNGNNGSISLNISGSLTPFQYDWNIGGNGPDLNNLSAGTYTCTVTDNSGCSIIVDELFISQPQMSLVISATGPEDVLCKGESTGSASLTIDGGTSPYEYLWNTGSTDANIMNQPAGSYTCTVTDANGCSLISSTINISEPATFVNFASLVISDLSCNGSDDGSIELSGTGGESPYSYLWNNGLTTSSISNLEDGPYQCTITDNNDCSFVTSSFNVGNPSPINLNNFEITNASCVQGGSISLSASGGAGPYNFNWSNGATGATLTNANAGNYACTITDAMDCELVTQSFSIILEDSDLSLSSFNSVDVSCFGETNGSINLAVTGTGTPFSYNWSNGANTQNISNLSPNNYTCTITDNNGCSVISNAITISQPASSLIVNNINSNNLSCADANDGNITLEISGGTMPYSYNWILGGNSPTASNLSTGTYVCTITDNNGCTVVTSEIPITGPSLIQLTNAVLVNANCGVTASGSIDISVSGGQSPYQYFWNTGATSQDLNGVSAGTYSCVITDNIGCTLATETYIINNDGSDLSVNTDNITAVSCFNGNNGAIELGVSGTATPFTFNWSNGETTQNISALSVGMYSCTISDANGCSSISSSIEITQPSMALSISNNNSTNISCAGSNDGNITIEAIGGTAPFSYAWSNGGGGNTIDNLGPGNYSCEVTDAMGCSVSSTTITISQPENLSLENSATVNVICGQGNIGSIDINISGGITPYTYLWNNGAVTQDLAGLSAGNYVCTVTDNNDCMLILDVITIDDEGSDLEIVTEEFESVSCFGGNDGTILFSVSGSATPFTYLWNNGANSPNLAALTSGSYTCTITDANGCSISSSAITIVQPTAALNLESSVISNSSCTMDVSGNISINIEGGTEPYNYSWSNGDSSAEIDGLIEGGYTCTITDANGCNFIVGPLVIEPSLTMSVSNQNTANASCTAGGFIEINIDGGTSPYSFFWNSGTNAQNIYNIPAGDYICTVTDAEGCTFTTNPITIFNDGTDLSWLSTDRQTISCFGDNNGSIDISVTGTSTPFSYDWSNGATTEDLENLSPGLYSCVITDASGCSITLPNIAINGPAAVLAQANTTTNNPNCAENADGNILLEISGGVMPYEYLWSNSGQTSMLENLGVGDYTCTVTDANACTFISSTIALISPPEIVLDNQTIGNEMDGDNSGSISISISGGVVPFTYLWSNNETTTTITNLSIGDYTCTVTDDNGCTMVFGPFMVDNLVSTSDLEDIDFKLYPNPSTDFITLESSLNIKTVRLLDLRGVFISSHIIANPNGQIDINALTKGVYIVEVSFESGSTLYRKIIKVE